MQEIPPGYIAELYRQTSFLSAVLGGFSIAFLGALLTFNIEKKSINKTIWVSAIAATLLIVSTFASVVVLLDEVRLGLSSLALTDWPKSTFTSKMIADFFFLIGTYALLVTIGLSGNIRDKKTGIITAVIACTGIVFLTIVVIGAL